jgi:hypothetical protein
MEKPAHSSKTTTPARRSRGPMTTCLTWTKPSLVVLLETEAHADDFVTGAKPFRLGFSLRMVD